MACVGRCPGSTSGCCLMIQQVFIQLNGKLSNYKMMQEIFLTPWRQMLGYILMHVG